MDFVHLHLHTQYSYLDGAIKIKDTMVKKDDGGKTVFELKAKGLMSRIKDLGQHAVAMTDHGVMSGTVEFVETARSKGIKPIVGCEIYCAPESRFYKQYSKGDKSAYHLTLLAQNDVGFRNLSRLSSLAFIEGFYFKPRIDFELLSQNHEGIICLSGCKSGELASFALIDDIERARKLVQRYLDLFGDRYYLEIQSHLDAGQQRVNKMAHELSKEFSVPLVATNDCHYIEPQDKFSQEVLMCIAMKKTVKDDDRIRHDNFELHLKSADEMLVGLPGLEVALENTVKIAERCEFEFKTADTKKEINIARLKEKVEPILGLEKEFYMPAFITPDGSEVSEYFARQAREGLKLRFQQFERNGVALSAEQQKEYNERLESEIGIIQKMQFPGYFLVVADFINWAKDHDISVGPGRGSGAGSLVAYAMRIIDINPIEYDLLFERFLNPDRVSLPDFDVDFCVRGREDVVKYVTEKYGRDKVSQICTFGSLKAKAAINDVGRVLGIPLFDTRSVAKLIPTPISGKDHSLAESLEMEPRLAEIANQPEYSELISLAMKLEGMTRSIGTHASGIVLADETLMNIAPLLVVHDVSGVDKIATQYPMKSADAAGLVKFDFLGLKTLTVLDDAVKQINKIRETPLVLSDLQLLKGEDERKNKEIDKVYELIASGQTVGIFQLESGGITEMVMRMKPNCFDDIIAILALYRPGPLNMGMDEQYIQGKRGKKVVYDHKCLEPILKSTYGGMIYQEQIMQIGRVMGGYSLAGADMLRRAMGKKDAEKMAKERGKFVAGAKSNGIDEKIATKVFNNMESFADYGFNKSHSAAYAFITYQTAYLKTFYPAYFMAALMSLEMDNTDKTLKNINECARLEINIVAPDVNTQFANFTVEHIDGRDRILFGLAGIKGVGENAVKEIVKERERGGNFKGLFDFCKRMADNINSRLVESLIKAGAFDWTTLSRNELMLRMEDALKSAQNVKKEAASAQFNLFGGVIEIDEDANYKPNRKAVDEWPVNIKLAYEKEVLGLYFSGHPLEKYKKQLERNDIKTILQVKERIGVDVGDDGEATFANEGQGREEIIVAGVISMLKEKNNKNGERYATFLLEDMQGTITVNMWARTYRDYGHLLTSSEPVTVNGRLDVSEGRVQLSVNSMQKIDISSGGVVNEFTIVLNDQMPKKIIAELKKLLEKHPGNIPCKVIYQKVGFGEVEMQLDTNGKFRISGSQIFQYEMEQLLGTKLIKKVG